MPTGEAMIGFRIFLAMPGGRDLARAAFFFLAGLSIGTGAGAETAETYDCAFSVVHSSKGKLPETMRIVLSRDNARISDPLIEANLPWPAKAEVSQRSKVRLTLMWEYRMPNRKLSQVVRTFRLSLAGATGEASLQSWARSGQWGELDRHSAQGKCRKIKV